MAFELEKFADDFTLLNNIGDYYDDIVEGLKATIITEDAMATALHEKSKKFDSRDNFHKSLEMLWRCKALVKKNTYDKEIQNKSNILLALKWKTFTNDENTKYLRSITSMLFQDTPAIYKKPVTYFFKEDDTFDEIQSIQTRDVKSLSEALKYFKDLVKRQKKIEDMKSYLTLAFIIARQDDKGPLQDEVFLDILCNTINLLKEEMKDNFSDSEVGEIFSNLLLLKNTSINEQNPNSSDFDNFLDRLKSLQPYKPTNQDDIDNIAIAMEAPRDFYMTFNPDTPFRKIMKDDQKIGKLIEYCVLLVTVGTITPKQLLKIRSPKMNMSTLNKVDIILRTHETLTSELKNLPSLKPAIWPGQIQTGSYTSYFTKFPKKFTVPKLTEDCELYGIVNMTLIPSDMMKELMVFKKKYENAEPLDCEQRKKEFGLLTNVTSIF